MLELKHENIKFCKRVSGSACPVLLLARVGCELVQDEFVRANGFNISTYPTFFYAGLRAGPLGLSRIDIPD